MLILLPSHIGLPLHMLLLHVCCSACKSKRMRHCRGSGCSRRRKGEVSRRASWTLSFRRRPTRRVAHSDLRGQTKLMLVARV